MNRRAVGAAMLLVAAAWVSPAAPWAQEPVATFKAGVDLVRVSATVRDHKGRFVRNLMVDDFEVIDNGERRPISDFRHEQAGISVALLFDISGSMEHSLAEAREAAGHLLGQLGFGDEAAVFTFDTRLDEVVPFSSSLRALPPSLATVTPFGATSLHDAIALMAERIGTRDGRRRALIVFTDGRDNASRRDPAEVSGIASAIDMPVYLFATVPMVDNPSAGFGEGDSTLSGTLSDLATWTGGRVLVASTPAARSTAARQIVDELRHQYLIAFESSGKAGWHPLEIRTRDRDLIVRARSGYVMGPSRPGSD